MVPPPRPNPNPNPNPNFAKTRGGAAVGLVSGAAAIARPGERGGTRENDLPSSSRELELDPFLCDCVQQLTRLCRRRQILDFHDRRHSSVRLADYLPLIIFDVQTLSPCSAELLGQVPCGPERCGLLSIHLTLSSQGVEDILEFAKRG